MNVTWLLDADLFDGHRDELAAAICDRGQVTSSASGRGHKIQERRGPVRRTEYVGRRWLRFSCRYPSVDNKLSGLPASPLGKLRHAPHALRLLHHPADPHVAVGVGGGWLEAVGVQVHGAGRVGQL